MPIQRFLKRVGKSFSEVIAITTSAGAADGGKIPATDLTTGRFHLSLMPTGIAPVTKPAVASETIPAGGWVNLYNNSGVLSVRKADGSASGKEINGFVLAAYTSGQTADVYEEGTNDQLTGLTIGADYWLDPATPGMIVTPQPTYTAGQVDQYAGFATAANELHFVHSTPVIRA